MNKVYLVWENEEDCGESGCSCFPRILIGIYQDKTKAEAIAKTLWGGRVTTEEIK